MPFIPGRTKTGGRKPGVVNKRTQQQRAEIRAAGVDPVRYMLNIVGDKRQPAERRDRMAVAVAPYVNPRLAVVDARVVAEVNEPQLTEEQRRQRARAAILEAFAERAPRVVEGEYKVIAGNEVPAEQANGAASEEREG